MAKKQFMTRAQRDWKPGTVKKPRSTKVMFASTILVLEAFTIFFGTLAVFGLHFNDPSTVKIIIWVAGLVLAGACIFLPAKLAKPWGYSAGWVLQGAMLLVSVIALPLSLVVTIPFVACWWYALHAGTRIDAENEIRAAEQEEWERKNLHESE